MKLFKTPKFLLTFAACTMIFTGCINITTDDGSDDTSEQVSNTDEEGRVNGDEGFKPEDVISDECADLGEDDMTPEQQEKCLGEFQDAYNPGTLSDECQAKYDAAWTAAEGTLDSNCEGGPDSEPDPACEELHKDMKNATDAFFQKCGDEVGPMFEFPWTEDHGDDMHCDPMKDDCMDPGFDCDPRYEDCGEPMYPECDPMKEDCGEPMYPECDPAVEKCPVYNEPCDPSIEKCEEPMYPECDPAKEMCEDPCMKDPSLCEEPIDPGCDPATGEGCLIFVDPIEPFDPCLEDPSLCEEQIIKQRQLP